MTQLIENVLKIITRLGACRRGGVAVFLALAIIPVIGFVGIGTDVARAYLVKSRLSSALATQVPRRRQRDLGADRLGRGSNQLHAYSGV